jgi:hypothetical protein
MSNFVVLLGRHVVLHRRICDFRDRQFAIQARLIKRHRFGAISVEQKKRGEIWHVVEIHAHGLNSQP